LKLLNNITFSFGFISKSFVLLNNPFKLNITLNDTNTYIVSTSFTDVNASSDESLVAICDLGDSIINEGYETDTDPNNRFQISDVQFPFPPTNMWFVNIQNIGDNPLLFLVYATCFDNPPTHIP
jgi:hypothetical protein